MSEPSLVLVGIPGSGTSTVGAMVAARLGVPLVEVDDLVETELGAPAAEVFASGEDAYRVAEERVTLACLARPGVVVAGSGAVDSPVVRRALAGLPVVWLRTSVAAATRRLGMTALGMDALVAIRDRMDAMLTDRAPFYAAVATLVVDTDRRSPEQVATEILQQGVAR